MKGKRSAFIYFWYQTDRGVPKTRIYSAVSLMSLYYNYLLSTAFTTMICWRCHSNSVNTGSRLSNIWDVKTRKRRNVVRIDMIQNNRIVMYCWTCSYPKYARDIRHLTLSNQQSYNISVATQRVAVEKQGRVLGC